MQFQITFKNKAMSKIVKLIGKNATKVKRDPKAWTDILKKEGVKPSEVEKIIETPTTKQTKRFFVKTK
jgi:hypothetical protein